MSKQVNIALPGDFRETANAEVWPKAQEALTALTGLLERLGYQPNVLHDDFITTQAQSAQAMRRATEGKTILMYTGWAYPYHTIHGAQFLPEEILLLSNFLPDFPGLVSVLAAAGGLDMAGIEFSRLWTKDWADETFVARLRQFLETGRIDYPKPADMKTDVEVSAADRDKAKQVVAQLRGQIYGMFGPPSMGMWTTAADLVLLQKHFGVGVEAIDQFQLVSAAQKVPEHRARAALDFCVKNGVVFHWGDNSATGLAEADVLDQFRMYLAALEFVKTYRLDFIGVQGQLGLVLNYPATDLFEGLMNNRFRPESDGETVVDATEADTGAAVMMQIMKLIVDGEPVAFNDVRYCHDDELWDFNNSGSLAPYFAHRRHDTLEGTQVFRQPPMYFPRGGGTCRVIAAPGEITWGRVLIRGGKPYLVAGRGEVIELPADETERRAKMTDYTWPHAWVRLRCPRDYFMATFSCNHAHFVYGDRLGTVKAVADELGLETVVLGA